LKQLFNKHIAVPRAFHEVLGMQTTLLEILLILIPSLLITVIMFYINWTDLASLPWINMMIMFLIIFDLAAGVIANFTNGTNLYYSSRPKLRKIFIAIHIQPLVISWLTGLYWTECLVVWLYTVIASFTINALSEHSAQQPVAAAALAVGIAALLLFPSLPSYFVPILALYMIKLILSFPVKHYFLK
jgi:hypothetical protein